MTSQTHAFLATALVQAIQSVWGVRLSRKRLVYGSVKPDLTSLFFRHPHFWSYSRDFLFRKISKLYLKRFDRYEKNKEFSEALGVVLHYIADFFTAAHNVKPNRLREHLAYEDALHAEFVRLADGATVRDAIRFVRDTRPRGPFATRPLDIAESLISLHSTYKPSLADPARDVREILIACLTVTSAVMDALVMGADRSAGQGLEDVPAAAGTRVFAFSAAN